MLYSNSRIGIKTKIIELFIIISSIVATIGMYILELVNPDIVGLIDLYFSITEILEQKIENIVRGYFLHACRVYSTIR